jgi:hypothetical protein
LKRNIPTPSKDEAFLVAPWIELQSLQAWSENPAYRPHVCRNGITHATVLRNYLNGLQPEGTCNGVRLGYTVPINVYDLFKEAPTGEWIFDDSKMAFYTDLFRELRRPVVVNLRANHFVGEGPLVDELARDETAFARVNDGSCLREIYFTNTIFAPTFSLDDRIPLNKYRFGGFRQAARKLAEFDRESPGLICAVTLAGELHHFLPELANPHAQGRFEGALMTDYSTASIKDFQRWLQVRYHSVAEVNRRFGTTFDSWDEVDPPRIDIRKDSSESLWKHMDSYADGALPLFGWAEPNPGSEILVYVNNVEVGRAEYGLNRTDVYEAIDRLCESDVGFRYELDYRVLCSGPHVIHVVLREADGSSFLIGRRTIVIGRDAGSPAIDTPLLDGLRPAVDERGGFAWLDHPQEGLSLFFNPFAAEWQRFREWQVETLLEKFASIALEEGLDCQRLYSHQIMPQFEGTWNRLAFAIPAKSRERERERDAFRARSGLVWRRGCLPAFA